jgi:hypothetical protein
MDKIKRVLLLTLLTALISACAGAPPPDANSTFGGMDMNVLRGIQAPVPPGGAKSGSAGLEATGPLTYMANGPYPIRLKEVPTRVYDPKNQLDNRRGGGRIESQISDEVADLLRLEAMLMPEQKGLNSLQSTGAAGTALLGPVAGTGFESLDYTDCCGGGGNVPPDSELAVGPNHIIAVVNVAFEIYDKSGTLLAGPTTFSSFFSSTTGCDRSGNGVFDPNVIYDEEHDRFILGIDGNGTSYCVAATTGPDPTGTWTGIAFAADINGNFFDYPHAGVGLDAIYLGANMFGPSTFAEGRVWAIDKAALYAGSPVTVKTHSTGQDGTPQPMNLHGFNQGTWPVSGPHYILTDGAFDGNNYGVWSWSDPFGANVLTSEGRVNLATATGVAAGMPVDAPQSGSSRKLQANDWRVQDAEYRNGYIWMSHTLACNPGGGTVDCIRWAQINPTGPSVVNAGVLGSSGEYRIFPDVAVNDCNDMAIGYTKTSADTYPSVYISGRESGDAPGTLQAESLVKAGEVTYTSFEFFGAYRWGDYSGMTIDPDGQTFWYLGEYSKNTGAGTRWGDYIASFSFSACDTPQPPAAATSPNPADGASGVDTEADLNWSAGAGALSHDIYFGLDPTPSKSPVLNQSETTYDPGTLSHSTTYYWQVDEVNDTGTTTGEVWSFTTAAAPVQPGPASTPSPADGAPDVNANDNLSWTAGANAISHDVYFGTSSEPTFQGNQAGTTFNLGTMANSTTYYWRVDEVNGPYTTTGDVWSFTTAAAPRFLLGSVTVETIAANGKDRNLGRATITVVEAGAGGAGVSGVAISGSFSGGWSGSLGGTTNGSGVLVLETPAVKNGNSFDFCVDTASSSGWEFDEASSATFLCNAPPGPTGSVAGIVSDAASGSPIANAAVSTGSGQNTSTAGDGSYTLSNVPTGNATVSVSASGYNPNSRSTTVTEGGTSTENFALTAVPVGGGTGSLKGTVTNANGARLQGVTVQVDTGQSATTNKGGKYSISNIPEGSRTVTASLSGYTDTTDSVTISTGVTTTLDIQMNN